MDLSALTWVAIVAAVLVGAAVQGAIGFGMNLVTVPILALVVPEVLPVAVILLGVPISVAMARYERASVDRPGVAWILVGRVPGTVVGAAIVATASATQLQLLAGGVVLVLVAASVAAPPVPVHRGTQLVFGAVSGVTSTTAGIGGPPLALLYQRMSGAVVRSTLATTFFVGTFLSIGALAIGGSVTSDAVVVGAVSAPFVVVGSFVGRRFHAALDAGWLRPAVLWFSVVSAVVVLVDAAA